MHNESLYNVVILSSSVFNENNNIQEYGNKIVKFLTENIPVFSTIVIGNIKNGNLIKFLKDNGFDITVKKQHPNSLRASNRKLINECDIAIFLNYNSSIHMEEFIKYADSIKGKKYYQFKV